MKHTIEYIETEFPSNRLVDGCRVFLRRNNLGTYWLKTAFQFEVLWYFDAGIQMAELLSYSETYIDHRRHAWIYISRGSQVFSYDFCTSPLQQLSEKKKKVLKTSIWWSIHVYVTVTQMKTCRVFCGGTFIFEDEIWNAILDFLPLISYEEI